MRDQRVIFTALPNGIAAGKLRISVLVSPRLRTDEGGANRQLSRFPDFVDWPATSITWQVTIGSRAPVAATVTSAAPRSDLWTTVFAPSTRVQSFAFDNRLDGGILAMPAARVRDYVKDLYGRLGGRFLTELPDVHGLYDHYAAGGAILDFSIGDVERSRDAALEGVAPGIVAARRGAPSPSPAAAETPHEVLGRALAFHEPRFFPDRFPDPPPRGGPKLDFHAALSMLNDQPVLMRALGLLVDLTVPIPAGFPAAGGAEHLVKVTPAWTPKLTTPPETGTSFTVTPATRFDDAFLLGARATDPIVASGLLRADDSRFSLAEIDVDGAVHKLDGFLRAIPDGSSPAPAPAPAMRTSGLSLVWDGRADDLQKQFRTSSKKLNNTVKDSPGDPLTLSAEDVVRGWRLDVFDVDANRWYQLCARRAVDGAYRFEGSPITIPASDDEGFVQLAITGGGRSPLDPYSRNEALYLHESMARWEGWSLVAPRPGKVLSVDPMSAPKPPPEPGTSPFKLQVTYSAKPGTLPRLRFGHTYRMRARLVDLAGNGLAFNSAAGNLAHATSALRYCRFEPVISPTLLKRAARTPGESTERLVVRSDLGTPLGAVVPCERHVAPPMTSELMAEHHGVLDNASGVPDKAKYALIAGRDGQTFSGGVTDPGDADRVDYFPTAALQTPYLPDVFARSVGFDGLPNAAAGPFKVDLYTAGHTWPSPRPLRLRVIAGSAPPALAASGAGLQLTVSLAPAQQATVDVHSMFSSADLDLMGHWQTMKADAFGTAQNRKRILDGQAWLFTPSRSIALVHAVRRPLAAPTIPHLSGGKDALGDTFVDYSVQTGFDAKSTVLLEMIGTWTESIDALGDAGPTFPTASAKIANLHAEVDTPSPLGFDAHHEFHDTKHRLVEYRMRGVTRFTEYFESTTTVVLPVTGSSVVDAAGVVAGSERVSLHGSDPVVYYQAGRDYTIDETAGTMTRIVGGSITPGNTLDVVYVAPPIDQTGPPVLVSVLNTSRPDLPEVRSVVPAFDWRTDAPGAPHDAIVSRRTAGGLRVWLERPWFSSGADELLGVVMTNDGLPPNDVQSAFTTRWGRDPIWISRSTDPGPTPGQFGRALVSMYGLSVAGAGAGDVVAAAGHTVAFDAGRKLWYCDIDLDAGDSYLPFVRLALARFQPNSFAGAHLSPIVLLDPIQLLPERTTIVQLSAVDRRAVTVTVKGRSYVDDAKPAMIAIGVEQRVPGVHDGDLGWAAPAGATPVIATARVSNRNLYTWKAKLTLPADRGTKPMRITVSETEYYSSSDDSRLVYADSIEI